MGTATDALHKTAETAPSGQADYCTYVEVYGKYFDASAPVDEQSFITTYRIYLGANNKADFNLLRNRAYTVNVTLRGKNEVDMRVESVLDPANCYMVSQPSKEYTFNATIMGNGVLTQGYDKSGDNSTPAIVPARLRPDGAMLLWETGDAGSVIEPGSVRLSDDGRFIRFKTSATIGGNAVIAATKNGAVIWSWHIWSTEYDPESSYDTYTTRMVTASGNFNKLDPRQIKVMKVNLGATSLTSTPGDIGCYGLYYQWGRKDPFIGANATVAGKVETTAFGNLTAPTTNAAGYEWSTSYSGGTGDVDQVMSLSIASPTVFFTIGAGSGGVGDWITGNSQSRRDNLWGNVAESSWMPNPDFGSKSLYDPCPAGWRVPPSDTWTMFTTDGYNVSTVAKMNVAGSWSEGWSFYCSDTGSGATVFYPATGLRDPVYGKITGAGYSEYKSSSSKGSSATQPTFSFNTKYVMPLLAAKRGNGGAVRCVKEE